MVLFFKKNIVFDSRTLRVSWWLARSGLQGWRVLFRGIKMSEGVKEVVSGSILQHRVAVKIIVPRRRLSGQKHMFYKSDDLSSIPRALN